MPRVGWKSAGAVRFGPPRPPAGPAGGRPRAPADAGRAAERRDRYRRPYEGTDNSAEAMQAYLEWEYGLVDQLARDGTHGFRVI